MRLSNLTRISALLAMTCAASLIGCGTDAVGFGTISTVAGNGQYGYSGDGGLATAAQLNQPTCAVMNSAGDLFIGDVVTFSVRKVDAKTAVISAYAGNGKSGYAGDGGPAVSATLYGPSACTIDPLGNLFIADVGNNVVRKITIGTGLISTVAGDGRNAGTGNGGFSGDGGPATAAALDHPMGVAVDTAGNLFISDAGNQRIREVDAKSGVITTVAGIGRAGFSAATTKASEALLSNPSQLTFDKGGNLFIAQMGSGIVSKLDFSTGMLTTVAGTGQSGDGAQVLGDGGPATKATLDGPMGVAVTTAGDILIADTSNQRIREVSATTGLITTVVGPTNERAKVGYLGDGGSSKGALLHNPEGLFLDEEGNLFIADAYNSVVRVVTPVRASGK